MSYETLKDRVADWLNRGDLESQIETFIEFAEAHFNRRLRTRQMLNRTALPLNGELVDLPSDYAEWRSLAVETSNGPLPLTYVSPDRANLLQTTETGTPIYFTVEGDEIRLIPAPAESLEGTLLYYTQIPALSDSATTNWLLTGHPDIYLYGTLLEAAPFLRDDERIPVWEATLNKRISDLTAASVRSEYGSGPLAAKIKKGFD